MNEKPANTEIAREPHERPGRRLGALVAGLVIVGIVAAIVAVGLTRTANTHAQTSAAVAETSTAAATSTTTTPTVADGVNQADLQACIASGGSCPDTVPGLKACMAAHLICNWAAYKDLQANNPVAQPDTGAALSMADAEAIARRIAKTPSTPAASDSAPVYAKLMHYGDLLAATGNSPGPMINPDHEVWVVTVEAPTATDGSPVAAPVIVKAYTAVLDAQTGKAIDVCIGCDSLAPGASALP